MDTLTIKGAGNRFDGDYECDIGGMFDPSSSEALTVDEAHLIKKVSGVRGNELIESYLAGDTDLRMGLAIVVAARHGKTIEVEMLRRLSMGATMFYADREPVKEDVDVPPTSEGETPQVSPLRNGGGSSETTSDDLESDPSRIGVPV